MDCRTASDYIMKYLDGEINKEQEEILMQHIDSCQDCCYELHSLKQTLLMLDEVEMEDAPESLDEKVMAGIRKVERVRTKLKNWAVGAVACIVLLACWLGMAGIILYTPAVEIAARAYNQFVYGANQLMELLLRILSFGVTVSARIAYLGRAISVLVDDFSRIYNSAIAAIILFMVLISELNMYVQKTVRR